MDTFEDLLTITGDAGPWQLRNFLLTFFAGFPAALQDFLYIFIAATPDHWCKVSSCGAHSYEEVKRFVIPVKTSVNGASKFSSCTQYSAPWNSSYRNDSCTLPEYHISNQTTRCDNFDFDNSVFESTIATEWDLVCDNEFWRSTSQAVYFMGGLCGSLVFGLISDNYGRKRAVVLSALMCAVFGPVVALAPTFNVFLIARFFLSAGSPGLFDISHVLVLETVGSKWRGLAGNLFAIPYGMGYAATAAFAYYIRNWRHLQLAVTCPVFIFLILIYFVPESPRWLMSQGNAKKCEKILRAIAQENGRSDELPYNFTEHIAKLSTVERDMREGQTKKDGRSSKMSQICQQLTSLFRTPKMRRRTLALNFCWFAAVLVYYGGAFNAHNLSANLFLYTLVSGLLEIPSYLIVPPLIKHLGRRMVFSASFFLCAAALSVSLVLEPSSMPVVALAWLGIFCIGASYSLIFVYGAEIMPTSVRSYGLGMAAVVGRGGSLGGLYASDLLGDIEKMAPTMVLVAVSLLAGFVALLLPETNKKKLPETVEDVENS